MFVGQLGRVYQFPFIREAFGPRPSLLLLEVEVSSGTGGIIRILARGPGFAASLDCSFDSTCVIGFVQGGFRVFIVGVPFDVRREVWSRKDIRRSLMELFSGNSQLHSRARDVRDYTPIWAGLTLPGMGESCGTADVYVHCRKAWSD